MALHHCFQPASLNSPHPSPTKAGACEQDWKLKSHDRPGDGVAELSGGTGRQCRGAVRRHWGQCSGAVRHGGSSRGPDHRASPTLIADLQLQQQDPVLRPVLAASTAKPSSMKERSTRALVQQYPRRFLKNEILRRGQADQCHGALQQLVLPSSFRPDVQERSGATSARDALWCYALGKKKGI